MCLCCVRADTFPRTARMLSVWIQPHRACAVVDFWRKLSVLATCFLQAFHVTLPHCRALESWRWYYETPDSPTVLWHIKDASRCFQRQEKKQVLSFWHFDRKGSKLTAYVLSWVLFCRPGFHIWHDPRLLSSCSLFGLLDVPHMVSCCKCRFTCCPKYGSFVVH